jgi:hypothetical protein
MAAISSAKGFEPALIRSWSSPEDYKTGQRRNNHYMNDLPISIIQTSSLGRHVGEPGHVSKN